VTTYNATLEAKTAKTKDAIDTNNAVLCYVGNTLSDIWNKKYKRKVVKQTKTGYLAIKPNNKPGSKIEFEEWRFADEI